MSEDMSFVRDKCTGRLSTNVNLSCQTGIWSVIPRQSIQRSCKSKSCYTCTYTV